MSHNRSAEGPGGKNTVDGNIFDYIRIVVFEINLEDVELEMLNLREKEFESLDTCIQNNPVLIKRDSTKRPLTRDQLWELACRYSSRLFKQYFHYGASLYS